MTAQSETTAQGYVPAANHRGQVEAMAGYGVPEGDIAKVLDIDPETLQLHYYSDARSIREVARCRLRAPLACGLNGAAERGIRTFPISSMLSGDPLQPVSRCGPHSRYRRLFLPVRPPRTLFLPE